MASEIARSELVQFLREIFDRTRLEHFAKTFCPQVWRALTWTPPEDVWVEVVDACIRRGMLDTTFFVGLVLFEPSRCKKITLFASHFGVGAESLLSVRYTILRRHWARGVLLSLGGLALGALISIPVAQGFLTEERANKESIKSKFLAAQAYLSTQIEECHELYGRESESCALLDQAIQSLGATVCSQQEDEQVGIPKKGEEPRLNDLKAAATRFRNERHETYRKTRDELLVCQERLAKAVTTCDEAVALECPPCPPAQKKACRLERDGWRANGCRTVRCKLTNDLDVIQLLDLEEDLTVNECKPTSKGGDDDLIDVPRIRR